MFSQSSSPYWGGKFPWIKFIYSSTPALHSLPWSCQRSEEWQWHELRRCRERVAPSHRRNGSRKDSSQITERKHRLVDLQSTRRQPLGWRMGAPDQDHKESSSGLMEEYGHCLDEESFRTLMCEVDAIINSRPLTTASGEPGDLEPLTPNHILTTKSTVILPPSGKFQQNDVYMRLRWRRVQHLANLFWSRWKKEYLVVMQERSKWQNPQRNLVEGDIVLIREENVPHFVTKNLCPYALQHLRESLIRTK